MIPYLTILTGIVEINVFRPTRVHIKTQCIWNNHLMEEWPKTGSLELRVYLFAIISWSHWLGHLYTNRILVSLGYSYFQDFYLFFFANNYYSVSVVQPGTCKGVQNKISGFAPPRCRFDKGNYAQALIISHGRWSRLPFENKVVSIDTSC